MAIQSKFETIEEFLKGIEKQFPYHLDREDFLKLGVKKKSDGYYHISQFFDVIEAFDKQKLEGIKGVSIADYEKSKHVLSPEFPILNIDTLQQMGRTAKIEAYNFSLLLFTSKFKQLTEHLRRTFCIPSTGISNTYRANHFKKIAGTFYETGLVANKTDSNKTFMMFLFCIEEWLNRNTDFKNKNYIKRNLLVQIISDYIISNDPFTNTAFVYPVPKNKKSSNKKTPHYGVKTPLPPKTILDDNIEIHIAVYSETTKEEAKEVIDSVWGYIENCKKRFPSQLTIERVRNVDLLKIKWQAYHLRKVQGRSHKEIAVALKLKESYVRKITTEIGKEVLKLKDGKLLP